MQRFQRDFSGFLRSLSAGGLPPGTPAPTSTSGARARARMPGAGGAACATRSSELSSGRSFHYWFRAA
eukprot:9717027-Alexandrium_andersonii.AAC.1